MSAPNLPEALHERLAALPRFEPSEALWARVEAARPRRRALPAYAAAAALAAGIVLVAIAWRAPSPVEPPAAPMVQVRTLEAELAAARAVRSAHPDVLALERELAGVDAALQSAYDRRAASRELDALWQARLERINALLVAYRHADTLVRI
ncbi:MAG TPA: hypothetical protein VFO79_17050 [Xanthomonadales bacterium]|nr:hypothetical protein [Xanthomonadales bacterium]